MLFLVEFSTGHGRDGRTAWLNVLLRDDKTHARHEASVVVPKPIPADGVATYLRKLADLIERGPDV